MAAMAESTEPESDEEIQRILDERHSKNTTKATKNALNTFSETVGDVQSLTSKKMLDKSLAKFFANVKKKDGSRYKANALLSLK